MTQGERLLRSTPEARMAQGARARTVGLWIGSIAAVAALSGAAREGHACGNGVSMQNPVPHEIATAERHTSQGKHVAALATIHQLGVINSNFRVALGLSALQDRAAIVRARAIARTDGRYGPDAKEAKDEAGVAANLKWAIDTLTTVLSKKADDPGARTDLAEALSHVPRERPAARRTLEELEAKDLVASAYGYAALARMRAEPREELPFIGAALMALDEAPREVALARCRKMASAKEICDGEAPERVTAKAPLPRLVSRGHVRDAEVMDLDSRM